MAEMLKSSIFVSDQYLCNADIIPPFEVRARIEVAVLNFLRNLNSTNPSISDLPLIDRSSSNCRASRGLLTESSAIFLSRSFCTRSLMNESSAKSFIRVWKVMVMCHQILVQEKKVTQRELFYKLLSDSPEYFTSQLQEPNLNIVDCSICGSSGYAISGDLNFLENLMMKSDARYIIVVEKHAIFQRLAEDRVFNQIPCILITAKGYPDIATRLLLHRMSREFSELPILGLVDWNPAGLAILCTFKHGSIGMGLEAYRYACNIKWLGLHKNDIEQLVPEESLIQLKTRDHQIAKSLANSEILLDRYKEELAMMVQSGHKAEIEALYVHGFDFLSKYLAKKIVQASYI
ncbi:meiotic recombination protein SPO11-2 isoform X2 [Henckelia pumila]|uniref:meiotic recombination protein SPO11-2 isoform X2 n=1 Tax=Henckelia pumila TaxID=405737 RepID=UPI003C6E1B20